jgi:hypothetical protein
MQNLPNTHLHQQLFAASLEKRYFFREQFWLLIGYVENATSTKTPSSSATV